MTHLTQGEPGPWFVAPSPINPRFAFSSVAGRYVLLAFLPSAPEARDAAMAQLAPHRRLLDDDCRMAFLVTADTALFDGARNERGLRWFLDASGEIRRLYGMFAEDGSEKVGWVLLDPNLRVLLRADLDATGALFNRLQALPEPDDHAGVPAHAPVLIVPRVFEPQVCRDLIAFYERNGGAPSGVMREVDGKTVGVLDDFKKRRDASIQDEAFKAQLRLRVARRLLPEIAKAFQFRATQMERYIVACYDADEGGYFRPHRDNTTGGTAHRQFAVSINLNAEEFEGGDLRFPEYGSRTYRPPTGGAVVFSCSLLHEATPVTRGTRYAFLPFLYDDAAAQLRGRNAHLVDTPL